MTWGQFKKAVKRAGVTDTDVVRGFRWFNDRDGKYYVTVWFEGEFEEEKNRGITVEATRAEAR
jgi:hypothetical protein